MLANLTTEQVEAAELRGRRDAADIIERVAALGGRHEIEQQHERVAQDEALALRAATRARATRRALDEWLATYPDKEN